VRELPFAEASRLAEWGVNASDDVLDDEDEQTQVGPFQGNDGCLVVSHLNIRSLVHKHDDLQVFLENRNEAHLFGLSETWLDGSVSDAEMEVPGFHIHRIETKLTFQVD